MVVIVKQASRRDLMAMLEILEREKIRVDGCGVIEFDALFFLDEDDALKAIDALRSCGIAASRG